MPIKLELFIIDTQPMQEFNLICGNIKIKIVSEQAKMSIGELEVGKCW